MRKFAGTTGVRDTTASIRKPGIMQPLSMDALDGVAGGVILVSGETNPFDGALSADQTQMIRKVAATMKKMGIGFRATAESAMQALSQSDGLKISFLPAVESYLRSVWDSLS